MSNVILPNNGNKKEKKSGGPKVYGHTASSSNALDQSRAGSYVSNSVDEGIESHLRRKTDKKWFNGDPKLQELLESYHLAICNDRMYDGSGQMGASFGFLSHLARRLPAPVLIDDPEVEQFIWGSFKPTAAMDSAGREWWSASFFQECLEEEAKGKIAILPIKLHEVSHCALDHVARMHNFPQDISNIAKDKVINPMVKIMFPENMRLNFSDVFKFAHGNNPEDARFANLSEETIGKILLQERQEMMENSGTIKIKKLIIEDGPATQVKKIKAEKGETIELDTVYVKVQDMGMYDKVDTEFICSSMEVDEIDNRLATRRRPSQSGQQSEGDSPIEIPVESSGPSEEGNSKPENSSKDIPSTEANSKADANPDAGTDRDAEGRTTLDDYLKEKAKKQGSGSGNDKDEAGEKDDKSFSGSPQDIFGNQVRHNPLGGSDNHEIDVKKLADKLDELGYEKLTDLIDARSEVQGSVQRAIEVALNDAHREKLLVGSGYPGSHISDYINTVIKPSKLYNVNVVQKVTEFIQGAGTETSPTMDDFGMLTYADPGDMGMTDEEQIYYPGVQILKPEGVYFAIIDTSGSIWQDKVRLAHLASVAMGIANTKGPFQPDVHIVGADTVMSGTPVFLTPESIVEAAQTGLAVAGGGGTDYEQPLQQVMIYCKKNEIKPLGIVYLGDFEVSPPNRANLPEDMPPVFFVGMPLDYAKAEAFIKGVSDWAQVAQIENDMQLDFNSLINKTNSPAMSANKP